jgi:hypothetical protein
MKTAQSAHFARITQHGERAHHETFDALDATFQPVRYDSRAYEQSDMHSYAIDRFSLSIDTLI